MDASATQTSTSEKREKVLRTMDASATRIAMSTQRSISKKSENGLWMDVSLWVPFCRGVNFGTGLRAKINVPRIIKEKLLFF